MHQGMEQAANHATTILEMQQLEGEPTLKAFSSKPGKHLQDKIYSLQSWQPGGRSKVSRMPRHNEPKPMGFCHDATEDEVHKHGRWSQSSGSDVMPKRHDQWDLADWILLTLLRMQGTCCMVMLAFVVLAGNHAQSGM